MRSRLVLTIIAMVCTIHQSRVTLAQSVNVKGEYAATLLELTDALVQRQIADEKDAHSGAIRCTHCNVLHTRAAEAVYPFAVAHKITKHEKFLHASINIGNWLIKQQ